MSTLSCVLKERLLTRSNYFNALLRVLEIAEVENPTWHTTSANGNPKRSTREFVISNLTREINDRNLLFGVDLIVGLFSPSITRRI